MSNSSRWSWILSISLALTAQTALADGVGTSKSYHGPTGIQLYSLRDMQAAEGVDPVLDLVKDLGFKYVEVAGLGEYTPAEFREQLDKRGLVPIGMHFPYAQLRDDIDDVVRDAKAMGLPYVGCAWIDHSDPFDEKQCLEAAKVFNHAGEALAKNGMTFYYHTHGYEFLPYQDGTLFDLLVEKTDPKNVLFQMDTLWVVMPSQDPAKLLKKYPDRWVLMHLKDLKKGVPTGSFSGGTDLTNDVALGTGQMDWPAIFQAAQDVGVKYYFIEDELPTVIDHLPKSLRYLESCNW